MCSIMGYCGTGISKDKFKEGLNKTKSRGPDMTRVTDTGKGLLGFHRLSIMGLDESGMQPFYRALRLPQAKKRAGGQGLQLRERLGLRADTPSL